MPDHPSPTTQDLRRVFSDTAALCTPVPKSRAAVVAMIFYPQDGALKLCLGRRATVAGDPWSGDLAFPGGKPDRVDVSLHDTAARETYEETGLVLPRECLIGDLGHRPAHSGGGKPLATFPLIYLMQEPPSPFRLNHELVDARWVSLEALWDAANWLRFTYAPNGGDYAAVRAMDHYLWGYSLRVLHEFSLRIERPLTSLLESSSLPRGDGAPIAGTRIG